MARAADGTAKAASAEAAGREVERELQALRAEVAALAKALRAYGGAAAEEVTERAQGASQDALAEALKAVRDLREQADGVQERLEGDVRAHPLAWLAGAAVLGLLVGMLLGRRA